MKAFKTGMAAAVVMLAATACGPTGNEECPAVACTLYCENGFQQGDNGCDICACVEDGNNGSTSGGSSGSSGSSSGMTSSSSSSGGPDCEQLACLALLDCFGPLATDEYGCPICACAPLACPDISDDATCRATAGCVPVYFSEDGRPLDETTTFPAARMECCTDGPNGVECGGNPNTCFGAWVDQNGTCRGPADGVLPADCCGQPVDLCFQDSECNAGFTCDTVNYCESSCRGNPDIVCDAVCMGRCIPEEPVHVCYDDGECAPGLRCDMENFCESACPPDAEGCIAVCLGRCVPEPVQACWSDESCDLGERCDLENFCESACEPGAEACPAVCLGRCVPTYDPCSVVRCGGGDMCVACGPNEDCSAKCVPQTNACAATLCAPGTQCVSCEPTEDCLVKCVVPVEPSDCRTSGCGEHAECVELLACEGGGGTGCGCPEGDDACNCTSPPPPSCTSEWICQGGIMPDPCLQLTEEQCMLDHDLCSGQYATACPDCAPGSDCNGECFTTYVGCFSAG